MSAMGSVMMITWAGFGLRIENTKESTESLEIWVSVPEHSYHKNAKGEEMAGIINQSCIQLNGEMIPLPPGRRGARTTTTVINDHIYINGFEYIDGQWKRTLKALWHHLF